MDKGIIYYTDSILSEELASVVRDFIEKSGLPITSASLKPLDFGDNEVIEGVRSYPTMVRQIISCLERSTAKYVYFCEHDVLYHPSHFEFTPPKDDIFYYNENNWRWLLGSDKVIKHDRMIPLSSMCANRRYALEHYLKRLEIIEKRGWDEKSARESKEIRKMGYEPGTKKKRRGGFFDDDFELFSSHYPNIDIRHKGTFSSAKLKQEDFKYKPKWWNEMPIDRLKSWNLKEIFNL